VDGLGGVVAEFAQEPDRPRPEPQHGLSKLAVSLTGEGSRVLMEGYDLLDQVPAGRPVLPCLLQCLGAGFKGGGSSPTPHVCARPQAGLRKDLVMILTVGSATSATAGRGR
jgi:hypothetical protein